VEKIIQSVLNCTVYCSVQRDVKLVNQSIKSSSIYLDFGLFYMVVMDRNDGFSFYSAPHCKHCTSYGNSVRPSVRPSVTRRYCVKTTARSTMQFALSDSKMCLVLQKQKIFPRDDPFP